MINTILILIGTYVVFNIVFSFIAGVIKGFNRTMQQETQKQIDHAEEIVHCVREENHNGRNYWFDADSDIFLAWGETRAEIIAAIKVRWPDHIFYLNCTEEIIRAPEWIPTPFAMNK